MVRKKITICLAAVLLVCVVFGVEQKQEKEKISIAKTCLTVGVFDSRAVALAYYNSEIFKQKLNQMREQQDKAKAAGDTEKVKELESWGQQNQKKAHMQGFSTADVSDLLKCIEDKIPAISENAGVDVIVSKWNITYQAADIILIDVTKEIVKAYNPSEQSLKWVEDLKNQQPMPLEELEKMDHTKF